jgi:hypothetical protein
MSPKNNDGDSGSPSSSSTISAAARSSQHRSSPGAIMDREKFYLDQIKNLEVERNQLRRDAEREKQRALAANDRLVAGLSESQRKFDALADLLTRVRVSISHSLFLTRPLLITKYTFKLQPIISEDSEE